MIVQKGIEKLFNLYKRLVGMDDGLRECPSIFDHRLNQM
jgi:hypothetical protein